ncbi:alpha/beta fold hydrolase [Heliobacterium gestii]|uniref:Alpha/beta fold hydrolase n=1 Tax=Heliomicrobium gestii TaxID=2699 RepID=A0A845LGB7_HELGE|nr:alpha/beta hydrolase [Heliomicrobium gestii]MBM7867626.1 proline iminopeptidase [Heliomicrobium gestii]MZP44020.1 alpha/beta fold hydrolase [Heliomicrobium gestii]
MLQEALSRGKRPNYRKPIILGLAWLLVLLSLTTGAGSALTHRAEGAPVGPSNCLAPGDHKALINGVELSYHVAGDGPVCVVHPGGPGLDWSYARMPEVEKHFRMVYLEPVGTGASGRLERQNDYTFERYVEDLEALRRRLGLEKMYLLGHSHGGMVAQHYALRYGERLQGLILYATTPVTDDTFQKTVAMNVFWFFDRPWYWEAMAGMRDTATVRTDEEATRNFRRYVGLYFADYDAHKQEIDRFAEGVRCSLAPNQAFYRQMPFFDLRNRLGEISAPVLILAGRKDFLCPVQYAEEMASRIKGAQLVLFEHSGHLAHLEEPAAFAEAMARFKAGAAH